MYLHVYKKLYHALLIVDGVIYPIFIPDNQFEGAAVEQELLQVATSDRKKQPDSVIQGSSWQ